MIDFDKAFDRLLGHEGGYVNHASDPGGETHWGISKRSYPHVDIKNLTREGAKVIYKRDYWDAVGAKVHPAIAFQVFDAAVNHGIDNATRMLQKAVGTVDDGYWGKFSQAAYEKMTLNDVLLRFLGYRLQFFTMLSRFPVFGRGWTRRIADNLLYAAEDN